MIKVLAAKLFAKIIHQKNQKWINNPLVYQKKTFNNLIKKAAYTDFGKDHDFHEINDYTEYGKLVVEGKKKGKEKESEYVYQGLAQRSFNRTWSLSEDIEVREVQFKDGLLTVKLGKIVPEHHARKEYM